MATHTGTATAGEDTSIEDAHVHPCTNIDAFIAELQRNAHNSSTGRCAQYVRRALDAGGADTTGHPVSASDYAPVLLQNCFVEISTDGYIPQRGDIYIISRFANHIHGHIAGYDGTQWISDFKQAHANIYHGQSVIFHYFRKP